MHLRNYLPGIVLSAFLIFQMMVLLVKTFQKYKQVKALEITHEKVLAEITEIEKPELMT